MPAFLPFFGTPQRHTLGESSRRTIARLLPAEARFSGWNSGRARTPAGFTIVELLVVVTIFLMLVVILMPAVNMARETARRNTCVSRLTQLTLAVHEYETQHETLPPGVINPTGPIRNVPEGMHVSWIVQVLPYLGENVLFSRFDHEAGVYAEVNEPVRQARLTVLRCPSDPTLRREPESLDVWGHSNYVGSHHDVEAPIDADNHGLLFLNSRVRYEDVSDGIAHTMLLGEAVLNHDSLGWASGTRATLRNGGSIQLAPLDPPSASETADLFVGGFGSYHAGGVVNVSYAEGAVRPLDTNVDPRVLRQLTHRADGATSSNAESSRD